MCKSRVKVDFEYTNVESNGKSSEEEEIKLPKCGRKGDVKILMRKQKKALVKRKRLEYVSVGEKS